MPVPVLLLNDLLFDTAEPPMPIETEGPVALVTAALKRPPPPPPIDTEGPVLVATAVGATLAASLGSLLPTAHCAEPAGWDTEDG